MGLNAPTADVHIAKQDRSTNITIENQSTTAAKYPGLAIVNYMGGTAGHPHINMINSGGSSAAPTATPAGRVVMSLIGSGHTGSGTAQASRIQFMTESAYTTSATPTAIVFLPGSPSSVGYYEAMRLTGSGSLGIGTSSPAVRTHIYDSTPTVGMLRLDNGSLTHTSAVDFYTSGTAHRGFTGWRSTSSIAPSVTGMYLWNRDNSNVIFGTSDTERVRIDVNGNVGIGTTNPQALFQLGAGYGVSIDSINADPAAQGTAAYFSKFTLAGQLLMVTNRTGGNGESDFINFSPSTGIGSVGGFAFYAANTGTAPGAPIMIMTKAGNVGIGTVSPTAKLDVAGSISAHGRPFPWRWKTTSIGGINFGTTTWVDLASITFTLPANADIEMKYDGSV